jgi:hypothetical protein
MPDDSTSDFAGTLPYASEIFGVYQPLAGWLGRRATGDVAQSIRSKSNQHPLELSLLETMFAGSEARLARNPVLEAVVKETGTKNQGVLSPVGLVTLFREYFFEFDNSYVFRAVTCG